MASHEGPSKRKQDLTTLDPAVDTLLDLMVDDLKVERPNALEPYEVYVKKVRLQLYGNFEEFIDRFKRGHQALLDELENDSESEK